MEEKNEVSKSSTSKETTPLLVKKEVAGLYTEVTKPENYTSESASVPNPAGTCEKEEAGADASKKHQETEDEVAESITSYEGMANIVAPAFGCGLFYGIWLCAWFCLSSFMIQFPLHVVLLSLPIAIGFMGARYMTRCPMSSGLPYAMMVVGAFGFLVLLFRLAVLLHIKFSSDELLKKWLQKATKLLEFTFLIAFICELCFAYNKSPKEDPLSPDYCEKSFYSFVCSINNVLLTLVVVWICLYLITRHRCMRRTAPP